MAQYYYAVAALPGISLDSEPPWSLEGFLEFAEAQLTSSDFELLSRARLEPEDVRQELDPLRSGEEQQAVSTESDAQSVETVAGSGAAAHWATFEMALRNALVRARTDDPNRQNAYTRKSDSPEDSQIHEIVREAHAAANPYEAERILDKARYSFLEELEVGHFFDIDRLVVYYLKLQLVTRRAQQTSENGRRVFEQRYDSVLEQMGAIQNL